MSKEKQRKGKFKYVITDEGREFYGNLDYHSDDEIHLRVWSNNPNDLDTMCGLFTDLRGHRPYYGMSLVDVTCPHCRKLETELNPDDEKV